MNNPGESLLLFGASVRSAALSALRAGLRPWCADLFADADLRARCPCLKLPPGDYPAGFSRVLDRAPPGPWMYTGALENRRSLVRDLARRRPLWGNDASVLAVLRSPRAVARLLGAAGLPCPAVRFRPDHLDPDRRWLVKPRAGAGGAGVRLWPGGLRGTATTKRFYFQEFIEGEPCSALFLGEGGTARLLGGTRQLVGETWLHARPFRYCGSVGPLALSARLRQALEDLGTALASGSGLRGLFGIDFILRDDCPWPVEVNPRYTASVEVLEYALGLPALALHRQVFDPQAPAAPWPGPGRPAAVVGKAVLFARRPLVFPEDGPWREVLDRPGPVEELPPFADVPHAGETIPAGRPILTLLARAGSAPECLRLLRESAAGLDRRLFGA